MRYLVVVEVSNCQLLFARSSYRLTDRIEKRTRTDPFIWSDSNFFQQAAPNASHLPQDNFGQASLWPSGAEGWDRKMVDSSHFAEYSWDEIKL